MSDPYAPQAAAAGPTIRVDGLDSEAVGALVRERLSGVLAATMPGQRWYGDKGRPVRNLRVIDVAPIATVGGWLALAIVGVDFADGGESSRYFVPLAMVPESAGTENALATILTPGERYTVVDGLAAPDFPTWLLERLERGDGLPAGRGSFVWSARPLLAEKLPAARGGPAVVGGAEQSNSAIRYDAAIFVKLFRRLRSGINPDEEIGRFLATRTDFRHFPLPLGTATYQDENGASYPLALAQAFVPSAGDGWEHTLAALATPLVEDYATAARLLGERTGQLHLAMASDPTDPAFAPEQIAGADAEAWEAALVTRVHQTAAGLRERQADLAPDLRRRSEALTAGLTDLERRAAGFRALVGCVKTRVHGDYHLGQVLRTPDDDWMIINFEGEPARTIAERRAKLSPLKDIAGMLRSFGYAHGAALRAHPGATAIEAERLAAWEASTRAAFLAGYRAEIARAPASLAPAADDRFAAAVAAWELDKALYEIAYELANRPDWLALPLDSLLARSV